MSNKRQSKWRVEGNDQATPLSSSLHRLPPYPLPPGMRDRRHNCRRCFSDFAATILLDRIRIVGRMATVYYWVLYHRASSSSVVTTYEDGPSNPTNLVSIMGRVRNVNHRVWTTALEHRAIRYARPTQWSTYTGWTLGRFHRSALRKPARVDFPLY